MIEMVGDTPITNIPGTSVWMKLEYFNPTGSIKDRVAASMVEDAEQKGLLSKGDTIVEPTSGNTGIALSFVAAMKGYKAVLVMPENATVERVKLMKAFGAEVVLTPVGGHVAGAVEKARQLASERGWVLLDQFSSQANIAAHEKTGEEAMRQAGGFDAVVAGIGTGGTLMGAGKAVRRSNPRARLVAVEPAEAPVLSEGRAGSHGIAGISDGFVPAIYDSGAVDEVVRVSTEEAIEATRLAAGKYGILGGVSTGANLFAALKAQKHGKVLTFAPDSGMRYLSNGVYNINLKE